MDKLLTDYKKGCKLVYASVSTVTVERGQVACEESGAANKEFRENTSDTTVSIASDLDTGSEANSTKYYVYAVADADATTFTCKMSTSSTAPSGLTCFRLLGEFRNGSGGNIDPNSVLSYETDHTAKPDTRLGSWATAHEGTTYSDGTVYQAATDGFVACYGGNNNVTILTDSSSSPTTTRTGAGNNNGGAFCCVRKGDYWKTSNATSIYWIPLL